MSSRIIGVLWDLIWTITVFAAGYVLGDYFGLDRVLSLGGFG